MEGLGLIAIAFAIVGIFGGPFTTVATRIRRKRPALDRAARREKPPGIRVVAGNFKHPASAAFD